MHQCMEALGGVGWLVGSEGSGYPLIPQGGCRGQGGEVQSADERA